MLLFQTSTTDGTAVPAKYRTVLVTFITRIKMGKCGRALRIAPAPRRMGDPTHHTLLTMRRTTTKNLSQVARWELKRRLSWQLKRTPEMETSMSRGPSFSCLNCLQTGLMEEYRPPLRTNSELKKKGLTVIINAKSSQNKPAKQP